MSTLQAKYQGKWIKVAGGGGSAGREAQVNWKQTNPSAADFIKNKPNSDDALDLVIEMKLVSPIILEDAIHTDGDGVILIM